MARLGRLNTRTFFDTKQTSLTGSLRQNKYYINTLTYSFLSSVIQKKKILTMDFPFAMYLLVSHCDNNKTAWYLLLLPRACLQNVQMFNNQLQSRDPGSYNSIFTNSATR